jgi:hypothetical protein
MAEVQKMQEQFSAKRRSTPEPPAAVHKVLPELTKLVLVAHIPGLSRHKHVPVQKKGG